MTSNPNQISGAISILTQNVILSWFEYVLFLCHKKKV